MLPLAHRPGANPCAGGLMPAVNDVARESGEGIGTLTKRHQGGYCAVGQLGASRLGLLQTKQGRVGGLIVRLVGPGCFPQGLRVAFHIQNVIGDLKRKADMTRIVIECIQGLSARPFACQGTEVHGGTD